MISHHAQRDAGSVHQEAHERGDDSEAQEHDGRRQLRRER